MRIGLFVPEWPPSGMPNGIVSYASRLVPELRDLGHEVFVLTPCPRSESDDPHTIGLEQYLSKPGLWGRLAWRVMPDTTGYRYIASGITSAVRNLREQRGLDVFEIEETKGWSRSISLQRILPVVVRLHGPWFLTGQFVANSSGRDGHARIRREGEGICAATAVTAPSKKVLDLTEEQYGASLRRKAVIPNPIVPASEAAAWRPELADRNHVLFVGRFDELKGGDLMLLAFRFLAVRNPALRLTFAGPDSGLEHAGRHVKLREYVEALIPKSVAERIDYRGVLPEAAIKKLRLEAFVTVVASRYETFPNTVLEAMACGCPVVATAAGGIPELLRDEHNGLLVPPGAPEHIALACERLLSDPQLASKFGAQARADCSARYSPHRIAAETLAGYQAAIDGFQALSPRPV